MFIFNCITLNFEQASQASFYAVSIIKDVCSLALKTLQKGWIYNHSAI